MVKILSPETFAQRASRTRLVLTDVDGVLTDGGVYYSDLGEELKRFSVRDGMGVELLRRAGVVTAFISRERSGSVRKRAEKLELPFLYLGIFDKRSHLDRVLADTGTRLEEVAYIGDDVNDLDALLLVREHGLTAAPADAVPTVREAVHFVCPAPGGHGAFRDFADLILGKRQPGEGEST